MRCASNNKLMAPPDEQVQGRGGAGQVKTFTKMHHFRGAVAQKKHFTYLGNCLK